MTGATAEFTYLDETYLPVLVLGVRAYPDAGWWKPYKFLPGREWLHIAHQTGGYACNQFHFQGTLLKPKSVEVLQAMNRIARHWLDSCVGMWGQQLDPVLEYRRQLNEWLDVDCNYSFPMFEEGLYPIDIEHRLKLSDEEFPKDLDDQIEWEHDLQRIAGAFNRWGLWVFGPNCD